MLNLNISIILCLCLVSCGTGEQSRYRDTSQLERPPILPIDKSASQPNETDDSAIPKKQEPGLGEAVYLTETTPIQLRLKEPYDKAWNTVNQALKLNDIKITDHNRNKGHIYVDYGSSGLFVALRSLFSEAPKTTNYLLVMQEDVEDTSVTASINNSAEANDVPEHPEGNSEKPADESEELLRTIYKTIRDDSVNE